MKSLLEVMNGLSAPYLLSEGSLLQLYRNCSVGTSDIDIGLSHQWWIKHQEELRTGLENKGFTNTVVFGNMFFWLWTGMDLRWDQSRYTWWCHWRPAPSHRTLDQWKLVPLLLASKSCWKIFMEGWSECEGSSPTWACSWCYVWQKLQTPITRLAMGFIPIHHWVLQLRQKSFI